MNYVYISKWVTKRKTEEKQNLEENIEKGLHFCFCMVCLCVHFCLVWKVSEAFWNEIGWRLLFMVGQALTTPESIFILIHSCWLGVTVLEPRISALIHFALSISLFLLSSFFSIVFSISLSPLLLELTVWLSAVLPILCCSFGINFNVDVYLCSRARMYVCVCVPLLICHKLKCIYKYIWKFVQHTAPKRCKL